MEILQRLIKRKKENTAGAGGGDMTTEAQTGVMWPQVKGCWKPPKASEAKHGFSPEPLERAQPCQHLAFDPVILTLDFPASKTLRERISVVLSHRFVVIGCSGHEKHE